MCGWKHWYACGFEAGMRICAVSPCSPLNLVLKILLTCSSKMTKMITCLLVLKKISGLQVLGVLILLVIVSNIIVILFTR